MPLPAICAKNVAAMLRRGWVYHAFAEQAGTRCCACHLFLSACACAGGASHLAGVSIHKSGKRLNTGASEGKSYVIVALVDEFLSVGGVMPPEMVVGDVCQCMASFSMGTACVYST